MATDDPTDYREHPELYRIGRGEQGVLRVQPYKRELLPLWTFKTPELARRSADAILKAFERYKNEDDFVGMDMARKYLQMGYTRARRYANHRSGRKYAKGTKTVLPDDPDPVKAASAAVFYDAWRRAAADTEYQRLKERHNDQRLRH